MKRILALIVSAAMLLTLCTLAGCSELITKTSNNSRYVSGAEIINNAGGGIKKIEFAYYVSESDIAAKNPIGSLKRYNNNGSAFANDDVWSFGLDVSMLDATGYDNEMDFEKYTEFIEGKDKGFNYKQVWNYYIVVTLTDMNGSTVTLPTYGPVAFKLGERVKLKLLVNNVSGSDGGVKHMYYLEPR